MKNKHVGLLIISIAILIFFIVLSFNNALEQIVNTTCSHGPSCPMYATIGTQKTISYSLMGFLVLIGLYVMFFVKEKDYVHTVVAKEEKPIDLSKLDKEEKTIVELVKIHNGSMYQSDIIKQTDYSKVKVTRILDKLEGKKLIDRKRRGMTNIVVLK